MSIVYNSYGEPLVYSMQYIYPNLYKRIASLSTIIIDNTTTVDDCFIWSSTSEGVYFWEHINEGQFERAIRMQPQLFEQGLTSDVVTLNDIKF